MIRIKYVDPNTKLEVIEDLDTTINIPQYIENLHKNFLCKDICTGENCRVWMFRNEDWILMGISD